MTYTVLYRIALGCNELYSVQTLLGFTGLHWAQLIVTPATTSGSVLLSSRCTSHNQPVTGSRRHSLSCTGQLKILMHNPIFSLQTKTYMQIIFTDLKVLSIMRLFLSPSRHKYSTFQRCCHSVWVGTDGSFNVCIP